MTASVDEAYLEIIDVREAEIKALVEALKAIENTLASATLETAFASVTHARRLAKNALKTAGEE